MTHRSDCTVKEEFRDRVNEIARKMFEGKKNEAEELLDNLGWERVGGGKGREVYEVGVDSQDGPREKATEDCPCVVKFATRGPGPFSNGQRQNREEIDDYSRFPPELTEGDPPLIVPVADWGIDSLWLSMPKANPTGGSKFEAERRLLDHGWTCQDIHSNNVGEMHGETVIFDFGGECSGGAGVKEDVDDFAQELEKHGAVTLGIDEGRTGEAIITFMPPEVGIGPLGEPEVSTATISTGRGPTNLLLYFGRWDDEQADRLRQVADDIADSIGGKWHNANVFPSIEEHGGGVELVLDVDVSIREPREAWLPHLLGEFYDDVVTEVDRRTSQRGGRDFLEAVLDMIENDIDGPVEIDTQGSADKLLFSVPGTDAKSRSFIAAEPEFAGLRLAVGPWPEGETAPVEGADDLVESMPGVWPEVDIEWTKILVNEGYELSIMVTPEPGSVVMDAADVRGLYQSFFGALDDFVRPAPVV